MSRKTRADSILDNLPANQQEAVERWLFEENLSYKDAAKRLHEDFNVRCSVSSLSEWYQRRAQQRMLDRIAASANTANAVITKFEENPADTYRAVLNMVGQLAFEQSLKEEKSVDVETLFNLTKLLIANRKEEVRAEALGLMRDKFQFDAAKACLEHLAELRQIASTRAPQTDKISQVRQLLFGVIPQ
jgi:hypothetical protein